jgi:hypothetical protein
LDSCSTTVDDYIPTARPVAAGTEQHFKIKPGALKVTPTGGTAGTLSDLTAAVSGMTGHAMQSAEVTFTETSGAGTYTGSVSLPAGATIEEIIVNGVALWNNAGACTMKVGDVATDNGYYTAIDLKATDLLAGESLSFSMAGGKAGSYIANAQVSPRYSATARVISGIITTASTGGSTGRTRMTVIWSAPAASFITAATKV